jgi:hypothetical protein
MKIWNVGLTTQAGENIGWHVSADNADEAIATARGWCGFVGIELMAGATVQRRDPNPDYNKYFDGNFRYVGSLL